jgi:hypothetical protein
MRRYVLVEISRWSRSILDWAQHNFVLSISNIH